MVFTNLCILVLLTKVASALEGLNHGAYGNWALMALGRQAYGYVIQRIYKEVGCNSVRARSLYI